MLLSDQLQEGLEARLAAAGLGLHHQTLACLVGGAREDHCSLHWTVRATARIATLFKVQTLNNV